MKLTSYLHRVGFSDDPAPTSNVLAALLRCHVLSIPFENLDVQLGVPLTMDPGAAYEKIVERHRGGWCYEQNGLFGWALSEIGFGVTRIAAAERRSERGDAALANHLCLLVRLPGELDSVFLADVGFGGSMISPIPLAEATHAQSPYQIGLRVLNDGHWQFREQAGEDCVSYDFVADPDPGAETAMARKCEQLQTNPESSFVLNLVAQKRMPEAHIALRGRVLTTTTSAGKQSRMLETREELTDTLVREFRLDVPDLSGLWPRIVERHEAIFG